MTLMTVVTIVMILRVTIAMMIILQLHNDWQNKQNDPYYELIVQIMQKLSKYLVIMTNEISLSNIWCSAVFTRVTLATVRGCIVVTCPTLGWEAFMTLAASPRFVCGTIDTIAHSVPFFLNHSTFLTLRWIKLFMVFLFSVSLWRSLELWWFQMRNTVTKKYIIISNFIPVTSKYSPKL